MKPITITFTIHPKVFTYGAFVASHALAAWMGYYYAFVQYACTALP